MDEDTKKIMEKLSLIIRDTELLEDNLQKLKDLSVISENDVLKVKEIILEGFHYLNGKVNNIESMIIELNKKLDKLVESK